MRSFVLIASILALSGTCYGSGKICTELFTKKQAPKLYIDNSLTAGEINAEILSYNSAYEKELSLYDIVYLLRGIKKTNGYQATTQFFRHFSDYTTTLQIISSVIKNHPDLNSQEQVYLLDQISNLEAREEVRKLFQIN